MSPETPPPNQREPENEPWRPRSNPPFGPEAAASVERSLAQLRDPDDALRILNGVELNGAAFAAYLMLADTNLAAENITDTFYDSYLDAWKHFDQFRTVVLENLGWLDAVSAVMTEQGIPTDHLTWNRGAIDQQIFQTYDAVHLDGWWHIFQK
ncbi:hypothetical protein ITJ43_03490 [Microbacterium sp. VKM Ac-2870]|uniref:hypothetical protein n=1 Tax=Microbacterium sp. VKM Ac-2870 TaxID=2783825 RepID=UPI00188B5F26|nr:hypothetical protein [Microbacterium sp. VKM Ac-2870]MBF4561190.1 hypothetical protein [Microbacterium sp. VKM Ac-2870]